MREEVKEREEKRRRWINASISVLLLQLRRAQRPIPPL